MRPKHWLGSPDWWNPDKLWILVQTLPSPFDWGKLILFSPFVSTKSFGQWQFQDLEQTCTSNHSIPRKFLGKTLFCNIVLLWKPVQGYGISHRFLWFYRHFIAISALFPSFPLIFHVKAPEPRSSLPPEVWQRHHTPIFEPGLWAEVSKMILMAKPNKNYDFGYNGYDYHYL